MLNIARTTATELKIDRTQFQERDNWCWAACVTVAQKFRGHRTTQRQVVHAASMLARRKGHAARSERRALELDLDDRDITSLFKRHSPQARFMRRPLSERELQKQIRKGKLVSAVVESTRGRHMILVYGYEGNKFSVWDPNGEYGPLTHAAIKRYQPNNAKWVETWKEL